MAKRLGVHRRLAARSRRAAVSGAGAFAARVLNRARWRTLPDGVPLVFARRRQFLLQSVNQRFDFSMNILVHRAVPPSLIRVQHSPVDRSRPAVGARTLLQVMSSVLTIPQAGRLAPNGTEQAGGSPIRFASGFGTARKHVSVNPITPPVTPPPLVQSLLEREVVSRSMIERDFIFRGNRIALRRAAAPAGKEILAPGPFSPVRDRLQSTLFTARQARLPSALEPLRGRAQVGSLPRMEHSHELPPTAPRTAALQPRIGGRTLSRVIPTNRPQAIESPIEFAGSIPVLRPVAITGRRGLVPLVPLRLRSVEVTQGNANRPPVRARSARSPENTPEHSPSAFAASTSPLVHARPRSVEYPTQGQAFSPAGGRATHPEQTTVAHVGDHGGSGTSARTAFTLKSANPQELLALSQRVYDLIVDRVRREKERLGR